MSDVAGGHEFSLGGRKCHGRLEFRFICDCTSSELDANTAKRASCFYAGGPVRVTVCYSNVRVVLGMIIQEKIFKIAVDQW